MTHAPVAVLRGHTGPVWRVAFSADAKGVGQELLASGSSDKTIRLWNAQTHEQLAVIPLGSIVYGVAFSPDGTRLAAGCSDNTIRLIDVARRQQVAELRGHTDYVHAVAWSPDGTRLASASGDFTVRIWDSLSAQERAKLEADLAEKSADIVGGGGKGANSRLNLGTEIGPDALAGSFRHRRNERPDHLRMTANRGQPDRSECLSERQISEQQPPGRCGPQLRDQQARPFLKPIALQQTDHRHD